MNRSIDALHSGECLRAVVKISPPPQIPTYPIRVVSSQKYYDGVLKVVKHWSHANNCEMTFAIFLPADRISEQRGKPFPALYFLSGLTCTHENAPTKSGFGPIAKKYNIAMIFPDTSPRFEGVEQIAGDDWTWGKSAAYYLNA